MAIPASGVDPHVLPVIDFALCTQCAKCAAVCPSRTLVWENSALRTDTATAFGCIGCGQCMATCASGAVTVNGRGIAASEMIAAPLPEQCATAAQFDALALSRRSIRRYAKREVEREVVQGILDAVATAPMGIPPSPIHITVFHGADKVQQFADDMHGVFKSSMSFFNPLMLGLMRLLLGRTGYLMMRDFIKPLYQTLIASREGGVDGLFYSAPLAFQFHAAPEAEVQDTAIAATYAMLAAQAYGLGTCMIGSVGPMLGRAKPLREKYGIPPGHKLGMALIAGYPAVQYGRTLRRKLGGVKYM
jgi:nitroreductase/Pyruvate/2-oxoacid:ferredoxin oxidoreductase delta subunit